MKKIFIILFSLIIFLLCAIFCYTKLLYKGPFISLRPPLRIEKTKFNSDKNNNGVSDLDDIVKGARQEVINKTKYKDGYYNGGFPPSGIGVCTDVLWRALKYAGYDLKTDVDTDIKQYPKDYSQTIKTPDTNIDFRRVKNLKIFLKKYSLNLTTAVIPYDKTNLSNWQRGDIVILDNPEHIAIISDKRRTDGIPYVIQNTYPQAKESDSLLYWYKHNKIVCHFRYPKIR